MSIRVLVVADDALARAGLATLLNNQSNCVVTGQIASNTPMSEALTLYRPDVIIWDTSPTIDHENLRDANTPIIALLPDASAASAVWAMGVRGIMLRNASTETLASAINAVADGLAVIDPDFAANLFHAREQMPTPPIEELTPRELQVLRLMAEGQSNKTIARELGISESTVKFHVNAILGKLNAQSRTEAVVQATRLGLILL